MLKFVNKQGKLTIIEKDNGELEYIDSSLKENMEKKVESMGKEDKKDDEQHAF